MNRPLQAWLRGVGLWTPAYSSFASWCAAGMPSDFAGAPQRVTSALPPADLLHPRLRRRTSVFTRATVSALQAAVGQGGTALADVRLVLVSSFGEIETTVELLAQLAEPHGPVSPTKFHNSVHNTATGYMSITSGNHRESTALAGGPHNLEIALLELLAGLEVEGGDAVLLIAEELLPPPFSRPDADPTFAVALHFSSHPGDLDLRVSLDSRPMAPHDELPTTGLPSMILPTHALLHAIGRLLSDEHSPTREVVLNSRADPAVDLCWALTLERNSLHARGTGLTS